MENSFEQSKHISLDTYQSAKHVTSAKVRYQGEVSHTTLDLVPLYVAHDAHVDEDRGARDEEEDAALGPGVERVDFVDVSVLDERRCVEKEIFVEQGRREVPQAVWDLHPIKEEPENIYTCYYLLEV